MNVPIIDLDEIERSLAFLRTEEPRRGCRCAGTCRRCREWAARAAVLSMKSVAALVERVRFLEGANAHLETDREVLLRQRDDAKAERDKFRTALVDYAQHLAGTNTGPPCPKALSYDPKAVCSCGLDEVLP